MKQLLDVIAANRAGEPRGIYSVCSAHPMVLEAAFKQGKSDGTAVLVEATANQVNQFGGYTGMKPADFVPYVQAIATEAGLPLEDLILGGDHLGPVCWCDEPLDIAMQKSADLIAAYVAAGFKKIHLDTSMACQGDPQALDDATVAARAARLCQIAEETAQRHFGESELVYVVGTEVPVPGGATEALDGIPVTPVAAARETVAAHQRAFLALGLGQAWSRVVGLVVQPGVEFDHTSVYSYVPGEAVALSGLISEIPNLVYEAHSTDYQPNRAYAELVRDHFAILKVGPQLTFALREALFGLSHIEDELVEENARSNLRSVCEQSMLDDPTNWARYYPSEEPLGRIYRRYSYSDRIRYYWNKPEVSAAVDCLMANLTGVAIPVPLLNQYMPLQSAAVSAGEIGSTPRDLVRHHVMRVTGVYADACGKPIQ